MPKYFPATPFDFFSQKYRPTTLWEWLRLVTEGHTSPKLSIAPWNHTTRLNGQVVQVGLYDDYDEEDDYYEDETDHYYEDEDDDVLEIMTPQGWSTTPMWDVRRICM